MKRTLISAAQLRAIHSILNLHSSRLFSPLVWGAELSDVAPRTAAKFPAEGRALGIPSPCSPKHSHLPSAEPLAQSATVAVSRKRLAGAEKNRSSSHFLPRSLSR